MANGNLEDRQGEMLSRMVRERNRKRSENFTPKETRKPQMWPGPEGKTLGRDHLPAVVDNQKRTLRRKSILWTREQYKRASGPMVYIFWSQSEFGKIALYVGQSRNGLTRPLDPNHHARRARDLANQLEFIPCSSDRDALAMEARLIDELKPKFNVVLNAHPSANS